LGVILVVEDDASLRTVIRMVLERGGYAVDEARHGAAALDLLRDDLPDLVIADRNMPVMTGLELIDAMRAQPKMARIPVVLLSGLTDNPDPSGRADAVIAKPFEPEDLLRTIRRLLETSAV
jgi:CheY-like chemotaxis protein